MTYAALAGAALAAGAAAFALCLALHAVVPREKFRRFHDVSYAVFLQLGVVFAVLLAFVFNGVWSEYQIAAKAINTECGSMHGVAILANRLIPPEREMVLSEMHLYLLTVVNQEWPDMEHRRASNQAVARLERLWGTVEMLQDADSVARSQMLTLLANAHQSRETRLFQMTQGVPGLVWVMLALFASGLVGCMLVFAAEGSLIKAVFIGCFASFLTVSLLTVHMLDYPFESALRLSPADFQATLAKVDVLLGQASPAG